MTPQEIKNKISSLSREIRDLYVQREKLISERAQLYTALAEALCPYKKGDRVMLRGRELVVDVIEGLEDGNWRVGLKVKLKLGKLGNRITWFPSEQMPSKID